MKQLHVDNATNRVILVSGTERKSVPLGPNLVTVLNYVGPFLDGLDEVVCINLVCEVDELKFVPIADKEVETRLTSYHNAYVEFYKQVGTARKLLPGILTEAQRADLLLDIDTIRTATKKSLGLTA